MENKTVAWFACMGEKRQPRYRRRTRSKRPRPSDGLRAQAGHYTERLKTRALGTYVKSDLEFAPLTGRFLDVVQEPFQLAPSQLKDSRTALAHAIEALVQKGGSQADIADRRKIYAVRLLQGLLAEIDLAIRGGEVPAFGQSKSLAAPKFGRPDPRTAHPAWPLLRLEALSAVEWLSYCMPKRDATAWVCGLLKDLDIKASPTNLDNWTVKERNRFHKDPGVVAAMAPTAREKNWTELKPSSQFNAELFGDVANCRALCFRNNTPLLLGSHRSMTSALADLCPRDDLGFLEMCMQIKEGTVLSWREKSVSVDSVVAAFQDIAQRVISPLAKRIKS